MATNEVLCSKCGKPLDPNYIYHISQGYLEDPENLLSYCTEVDIGYYHPECLSLE